MANYAVAARNLKYHKRWDVSSVEVNDFMRQRAKEYPICVFALLEIRMDTVLKLMCNS
jgi:hypothetical protein